MRIAMVCLGNICRSPMAESVASAMIEQAGLASQVTVESFGTAGYHAGEGADPRADAALKRRGWPAGRHRAQQLTAEDVAGADLVLCADRATLARVRSLADAGKAGHASAPAKVRLLRTFDPSPEGLDVPDPWAGDDADFDRALTLVERACGGLVDHLGAARRR